MAESVPEVLYLKNHETQKKTLRERKREKKVKRETKRKEAKPSDYEVPNRESRGRVRVSTRRRNNNVNVSL